VRAHLLVYDIPAKSKVPNPSGTLRRWGVRVNLSAWIIPDKNVPLLPIEEWRSRGVTAELVRFDENDGETIMRLAREALVRECTTMRTDLDEGITEIKAAFDDAASGDDEALKKAGSLAYRHIRRAKIAADSAEECALTFDLMGEVKPLVEGLRQLIKSRSEMYYGFGKAREDNKPLAQVEADLAEADLSASEHVVGTQEEADEIRVAQEGGL
jgi:hypothetical protein